jgi:hypothetical protein
VLAGLVDVVGHEALEGSFRHLTTDERPVMLGSTIQGKNAS